MNGISGNSIYGMMKNYTIFIWLFALVIILSIASGCESDIPTSYPQIELPPTNGQSTSIVLDDIIEIPPSELWHKTIDIPPTLEGVRLIGWCVASGGARNDVKVLVLNDIDFHNWRNFSKVNGLYQSEKTTVADITTEIDTPGKYHLVISNWFSEFSSKKVISKVYLYWSVKPISLKIGADSEASDADVIQVPASANVNIAFEDESCVKNIQIHEDTAEATPISVSINGTEVAFVAPAKGTYVLKCGENPQTVQRIFTIIPSVPTIGQGLTVDSSTPNAPPRLTKINNHSIKFDQLLEFTVEAVDPDDDVVFYYACNLPPGAEFDSTTGKFTWKPPQGSAGKKYFVHFEASDGVLSDTENIVIEVR